MLYYFSSTTASQSLTYSTFISKTLFNALANRAECVVESVAVALHEVVVLLLGDGLVNVLDNILLAVREVDAV